MSDYHDYDADEFDEEFDEERYRDYKDEHRCWCGGDGIDQCDCCGVDLCPMCYELGAGFCQGCPTEEWIAEQEAKYREYKW